MGKMIRAGEPPIDFVTCPVKPVEALSRDYDIPS